MPAGRTLWRTVSNERGDAARVHALSIPIDVLLNSSVNLQGATLVLTKSNPGAVCAAFRPASSG